MPRTAAALDSWNVTYCRTRALADRTLFDIRTAGAARPCAPFWQFCLALRFQILNHLMGRLLSPLDLLDAQRPFLLLQGDAATIPQLLTELLYVVADILLCSREETLQDRFALGRPIAQFRELHADLDRLTERFDNIQQMLLDEKRQSANATRT